MEHHGVISLLPTLTVVFLALWTRKTFEALLGGTILGYLLLSPQTFFSAFSEGVLRVMQDSTIGWIILVCGLFGSLIHLLAQSGGALAFADFMLRHVKSRRGALLVTWLLGLSIFIDDYLSALTVGSTMKKLTDRFQVPREMLAYVVDSTAAPVCVLIPLSTWAIYIAGLLESEGVTTPGMGLQGYLQVIPFIAYGWAAAVLVPLVALGILPPLGAMRKAEERAKTGILAPPGSEAISLHLPESQSGSIPKLGNFVWPVLVLIGATVYYEIDAFKGILTAVAFTIAFYVAQKAMSFAQTVDGVFEGFKTMLHALAIVVMSFVLKEVNEQLGLTTYIIDGVSPWMNRALLPVIAFVSLSVVTFATGSFWGVYAISLPIIIPLAASLEVHPWLAIGTVVSAGAFGSHACFYGDATVLSSSATGCNNMAHVLTQLPYALLAGLIAVFVYLILGYTM